MLSGKEKRAIEAWTQQIDTDDLISRGHAFIQWLREDGETPTEGVYRAWVKEIIPGPSGSIQFQQFLKEVADHEEHGSRGDRLAIRVDAELVTDYLTRYVNQKAGLRKDRGRYWFTVGHHEATGALGIYYVERAD